MMYQEFIQKTKNIIDKKLGFDSNIQNIISEQIYKEKIEPMYLASDATCATDFCKRYGMYCYNRF